MPGIKRVETHVEIQDMKFSTIWKLSWIYKLNTIHYDVQPPEEGEIMT